MRKSKIKNILKIALSIIMVVVICIVTMGSVPTKIYTAYIDPRLKEVLAAATATDLIPVDIWLYEIDTNKVEEKVLEKTGFSKASLANEKTAAEVTHAEVDAYIETERAVYAEAQTTQSQEFLNKHSKVFGSRTSEGGNLLFVSRYAPVIQAELTPAQIATMAKDLSVEAIFYSPEVESVSNSDNSFPAIGANYARDTLGLTGTGIKIGILESDGLPERGSYNIPLNKIVFDPNVDRTIFDGHATSVASIIMGQDDGTYEGIVPDAYVYATYNYEESWRQRVEWLISRGVNIINISMGFYYGKDSNNNKIYTGKYHDIDKWVDHVALQHHVHIVASAGNEGSASGYINSPGLAYNVITVGNLNINESTSLTDDSIYSTSSYIEVATTTESPNKPDIVAPGHNTQTGAEDIGGTSAAAPHVTGILAQLCQAYPSLKTNPAMAKAVLCASASSEPHSYYTTHPNYDKYGAGLVNVQRAYSSLFNNYYVNDNFSAGTVGGTINQHTFTINSTKSKVKLALTWLNYKYINNSQDHSSVGDITGADSMPNLDINIFDSNNNFLTGSAVSKGNVEVIDIYDLPAGTYTIKVIASTGSNKSIHYSVAWWY